MSGLRFGFCEWYMPFQGRSAIQFARDAGYEGLQIADKGGAECGFPMNDVYFQRQYLEACGQYGVELQIFNLLSTIGTGGAVAAPESAIGQEFVRAVEKACEACCALHIPALFIPGCLKNMPESPAEIKTAASMLKHLNSLCAKYGIELMYESFMDAKSTQLLWTQSDGAFRLLYDVLNPIRYGFSEPEEDLTAYGTDLLACVHVKDGGGPASEDCLLGKGAGKVARTVQTLRQMGYQGWIVNENNYWSRSFASRAADYAAEDLRTIKQMCHL